MRFNAERWNAENTARDTGATRRPGVVPGDDYDRSDYLTRDPAGMPPFDPDDPLLVALRDSITARGAGR